MYILDYFIDMGLKENEKWKSKAHRDVASATCLCNPNVFSMDVLCNNVQIINQIPVGKIKEVTPADLVKAGCRI